jgi:hypothetical protein
MVKSIVIILGTDEWGETVVDFFQIIIRVTEQMEIKHKLESIKSVSIRVSKQEGPDICQTLSQATREYMKTSSSAREILAPEFEEETVRLHCC